jgi:excisionase family DNA binding protein
MNSLIDWLTTQEASSLSGYHLEHIRRLIRNREIEAKKWGKVVWMVNRASLLEYMEKMKDKGEKRGPKFHG